ncbi:hypothetical protein BDW74DRAFT_173229 [Aspergillus multicolor]|uniref:uncharacterized protein n=1 Tax=Aspergillus multicolor TaxID=41759 RepID=UPI003CCD2569
MPLITRGISLVNFTVASSALAFQVFVLYPWHNQLDDEFKALKREHLRVLHQVERALNYRTTIPSTGALRDNGPS